MLPTIDNSEISEIYNFLTNIDKLIEFEKQIVNYQPIYDDEGNITNPFQSKVENLELKLLCFDGEFYFVSIENSNPRWVRILLEKKFSDKRFYIEYYQEQIKISTRKLYQISKMQVYQNGNFENKLKQTLDLIYDWIQDNNIIFEEIEGQIMMC